VLTGTRLGVYEILEPIGAGGMGEVFRARDTRLQRDVALKLLPSLVASDPDRLARFTKETSISQASCPTGSRFFTSSITLTAARTLSP
jgi:serine/threonine protein kinase